MKTRILYYCVFLALMFSGIEFQAFAEERRSLFNEGWKFHRGSLANAEQPAYNDAEWRILNLPHDWSIEPVPIQHEDVTVGPFSKLNESGQGGADYGQTLGGEGWYRKEFTVADEDADKLITLYFEGVYNQSEVFINGVKVNFNHYGYTSYKINITDYCNKPGIANVIAVRVVNVGENSRWYSGSGIFRNVWLIRTDKVHLEEWDTFVDASRLNGRNAEVELSAIIHNEKNQNEECAVVLKIFSPQGKEVYVASEQVSLQSGERPYSKSFTIAKPELWSVEIPVLYRAELSVSTVQGDEDKIVVPFGIRTISFSAKEGFSLNGKPMKLKGACIHHDNGLLGAAAIDRAEEKKVELLKANGYNAVRCAHNQVSEYFLDVCDRLGNVGHS